MYDVVVKKFTFAISFADEFLVFFIFSLLATSSIKVNLNVNMKERRVHISVLVTTRCPWVSNADTMITFMTNSDVTVRPQLTTVK